MKSRLLVLLSLLLIFIQLKAQEPPFPITNFTTNDYGKDFNPSNSAIIQDNRGIIYAANGFKLMEFDGNKWNSYPINKEVWILSLAIDSSGIIYAGSQNEFGFFAPDAIQGLKYISLSDSLDIEDMNFSAVWKVYSLPEGIVFQSEEKLFFYSGRKLKVISPESTFHTSFVVNGKLYVRERGKGLKLWNGEKLQLIKEGDFFSETGIFLMLPYGKSTTEILIGTREKGFWILDPFSKSKILRPFPIGDIKLIDEAIITGGTNAGDDAIAIGTRLNGVFIIDTLGKTKAIIDVRTGITNNVVKDIITDRNNNLWLALENGISRIETSSPISLFSGKSGLTGSVFSIAEFRDRIWAGTSAGLFVKESKSMQDYDFTKAFNISSPVRSLLVVGGNLFVSTDDNLYTITGTDIRKIGSGSYSLWYSSATKLLFSAGYNKLEIFRIPGASPALEINLTGINNIICISGIDSKNSDSTTVWLGSINSDAVRIVVHKNLTWSVDKYNSNDGLVQGPIFPFTIDGSVVFGTNSGLICYRNESPFSDAIPDSLKNNRDFIKGYFSSCSKKFKGAEKSISSMAENAGRIWVCSDNSVGYFNMNNPDTVIQQPFRGMDAGRINVIYPTEGGFCWIGATEGLFRFSSNWSKSYNSKYYSIIRKVTAIDFDSILFAGVNFESADGVFKIVSDQPDLLKPILKYSHNSVRIEFAAPYFESDDKIMFSCFLEKYDSRWSEWEHNYFHDYKNLREGDYSFRVKARNVYGIESIEAVFRFSVLPPWYRTGGAYVFYGVLAVIFMWLIVRIYSYRLKNENIRLEGIVAERTEEVVKQRDEIGKKNVVLEYQKKEIEDSIRYARRIQKAVIPEEHVFVRNLPDGFVFFRPLDIVSGDFYWISRVESKTIITAADCTGHGVPGAFMSMLGVAFLNEIVNKDLITDTDEVLNRLREKVINALQQRGISGETKDGMDISLLCLDEDNRTLHYSGAFNPLIMIRNNELTEIEADRMPIAIYDNMFPFTKNEISLQTGDTFYIFSDGYIDQFGGPDHKKFKMKQFKQLLLNIHQLPMSLQKEKISKTFEEWRGDSKQIDDIVVVGLTVK